MIDMIFFLREDSVDFTFVIKIKVADVLEYNV